MIFSTIILIFICFFNEQDIKLMNKESKLNENIISKKNIKEKN